MVPSRGRHVLTYDVADTEVKYSDTWKGRVQKEREDKKETVWFWKSRPKPVGLISASDAVTTIIIIIMLKGLRRKRITREREKCS